MLSPSCVASLNVLVAHRSFESRGGASLPYERDHRRAPCCIDGEAQEPLVVLHLWKSYSLHNATDTPQDVVYKKSLPEETTLYISFSVLKTTH